MGFFLHNVVNRGAGRIGKGAFQPAQRVIRDVQPQHVTLKVELIAPFPLGNVRYRYRQILAQFLPHPEGTEQVKLPGGFLTFHRDSRINCLLMHERKRTAGMPQIVKRTRFNERINGALIAHAQRHFLQEIAERLIPALLIAGGNHTIHHVRAHVTDCAHAEADIVTHRGER